MAKETKTAAATPAAPVAKTSVTPPAAKSVAEVNKEKAEKAEKDVFKRVFKDGKAAESNGKKLPPQAQGICNILEAKPAGMTRAELVKAMDGVVTTKQPLGRILSYYQKDIVDRGMVEIVKAS